MKLSEALDKVRFCAEQMNSHYGKTVFDEWALVSLKRGQEKIVSYSGPRKEHFQRNFSHDLGSLRAGLLTSRHDAGDFDFSRHGVGTGIEAFVCAGDELYLICNNTQVTMNDIAREQRWLDAQKPFLELTDQFRSNPVAV